jgi:hypothetical protein
MVDLSMNAARPRPRRPVGHIVVTGRPGCRRTRRLRRLLARLGLPYAYRELGHAPAAGNGHG